MLPLFKYYPNLIGKIPHISFCSLPTPIEQMKNLGHKLGHNSLFVKRDDISARDYGGNKVRKLEFLLADARQKRCKEVITFGFAGSNHATATAIYANKIGLKTNIGLLLITSFVFLLSSCSKEPANNGVSKGNTGTYKAEESKEMMESTGLELVEQMDQMKDVEAVAYSAELIDFINTSDPFADLDFKNNPAISVLKCLKDINEGDNDIKNLNKLIEKGNDPESVQEAFEEVSGIYTWSYSLNDWSYSSSSDDIVFVFPVEVNGLKNLAYYTISYQGTNVEFPDFMELDYSGDVPDQVSSTLTVNGDVCLSYKIIIGWNADGIPGSIISELGMGSFMYTIEASYSSSNAGLSSRFTNNSTTIFDYGCTMYGNFSLSSLQDFESDYYDDDPVIPIESYYIYYQLLNLKVDGTIDVTNLEEEIRKIDNMDYDDWDEYDRDMVTAINKYCDFQVTNASSNALIADLELYTYMEETHGYYDTVQPYTDQTVSAKFVFSDGSSQDVETYFESGFDNLIDQINTALEGVNEDYDIDPIEIK